ncbi:primosomal protein N' [Enterobacteriaceae endosymbiont of Donacia tomentosa]|uniref:replication restart helicase PriA n=1 Tax=Enterobacteriaceae endosymbiont of Donacia tomentosa TaxID=2675787 RepID=UPI001449A579|nr:primosomal protein N' [Enterobacteriaceae endosymbiont of Donacia tomentosa]QJC31819.1 primosomal protein N' [Enterobacteriaceae endosymbiont of Donacia tomentosa]
MKIIKVVLNNNILYNAFDYLLPNNMIVNIGCRVLVPIKNKIYIGIVIKINNSSKLPTKKLKFLYAILDKKSLFNSYIWNFAKKISQYYQYSIGIILFKMLPAYLKNRNHKYISENKKYYWILNYKNINNIKIIKLHKQNKVLNLLKKKKINFNDVSKYGLTNKIFFSLAKEGLCFLYKKKDICNTNNSFYKEQMCDIQNFLCKLNFNIDIFTAWITKDSIIYLENINMYLNIIKMVLHKKKQILIIVPQQYHFIFLYQYFLSQLNTSICFLYANISNRKKFLIWKNIKKGKILIIIGTKSSIFMQFLKLGLIILNEEHDIKYKQTNNCQYNTRDIAVLRSKIENIPIILSSKTLSLETLHNITIGKYKFLCGNYNNFLYNKYYDLKIINMNNQNYQYKILSNVLINIIQTHITNKEQIVFYFKNKGYSQIILCNFCKKILKCMDCNKNFVFYKKSWKLYCIYCKKNISMFAFCPFCKNNFFIPIGIGTEQLTKILNKLFPFVSIININNKNFLENFSFIYYNKPMIIITSQILYKGYFRFLKNNLIIFLNVDNVFFSKNFRATENFIQHIHNILYNHLDEKKKKTVIIQTSYSKNYFIKFFNIKYTYDEIADFLLQERKIMLLPPFTHHAVLIVEASNKIIPNVFLFKLKNLLISKYVKEKHFHIIGPISLIQNKRKGLYRKQIILQHILKKKLQYIIKNISFITKNIINFNKIKLKINIDPINF